MSVTIILFSSFKFAYQLLKLTFLSTTSPNRTDPSPQAAEQRVPSGDQVIFSAEPHCDLLKEYVQPVLSQSLSMPNAPTEKYYPLGLHATEVIT
jgi:hypothetical protein